MISSLSVILLSLFLSDDQSHTCDHLYQSWISYAYCAPYPTQDGCYFWNSAFCWGESNTVSRNLYYDGSVETDSSAAALGYSFAYDILSAPIVLQCKEAGTIVPSGSIYYKADTVLKMSNNKFLVFDIHYVNVSGLSEDCSGNIDNDGDGFVGCADVKCKSKPECSGTFNSQCIGCCGGDNGSNQGTKPTDQSIAKILYGDGSGGCTCKANQASGDSTQTSTPPAPTPCEKEDGEPIGVNSGYLTDSRVDITLPGRMVAAVIPYYHSQLDFMGPFGHGWSSLLSVRLFKWTDGSCSLRDMWGRRENFSSTGANTTSRFYASDLSIGSDTISIRLDRDHIFQFDPTDGVLLAVRDDRGASVRFEYETSSSITGSQTVTGSSRRKYGIHGVSRYAVPHGLRSTVTQDFRVNAIVDGDDQTRRLTVNWDSSGMISSIADPAGRTASYLYDSAGNLSQVTFPDGTVRRYRWTNSSDIHRLTAFDDKPVRASLASDTTILTRNTWDAIGRVTGQSWQGANWTFVRSSYAHDSTTSGSTRTHAWMSAGTSKGNGCGHL
jgi:YD repeat-containing protein